MELSDKDFIKDYFVSIGHVWRGWFNGEIGNKEREDILDTYRSRLNKIIRGVKEHEEIRIQEEAVVQEWTSRMLAWEIANSGVAITKCPTGVARGLTPSDFIKGKSGGSGRTAEPINTDDPKYNMYANALPAPIRHKVCAAGLDVRQLYKEYRNIGRDAMVAKYGEL